MRPPPGPLTRWGVLAALVIVALGAWAATGDPWPWLYGLGAAVVLAVLGIRARIGPVWTAAVAVGTADLVWLLAAPWWAQLLTLGALALAVLAGLVLAGRIPMRHRRTLLAATTAGVALLAGGGAGGIVHAVLAAQRGQQDLDEAHQQAVARILPRDPGWMLQHLVIHIATRQPDTLCWPFTPPARAQIARAHGAPDCRTAGLRLAERVTSSRDYQDTAWLPSSASTPLDEHTTRLDACDLDITGGPADLGRFTLRPYRGQGLQVIHYTPC